MWTVEDSIYFRYTEKELATNVQLVKRIVNLANELGRPIATPEETREILGLNRPNEL